MKRHERARRLGACLVLGCACVTYATTGYADWEAIPDITLEAEANDNPTLNVGVATPLPATPPDVPPTVQPQPTVDSASRLLADVVLRLRRVEPRGEISFEPRVRRDAYLDEEARGFESTDVFLRSSGVHRGQTVRIGYLADIARERILGIEFLETLPTDAVSDDPSAIATTEIGANERRTRVGVAPYIDIELSSRGTIRLDGRILDVDYSSGVGPGRSDFLDRTIGGEYQRSLDERGTFAVRLFATGYEAALNNNVTDTRGVQLSYGRDVSELWSWTISGGTQRSDFALSAGGRRVRGTDNASIFGLAATKRGEVSSMRAELQRRMSPYALGFVAPRDEVRIAWQRMLSPRVNGRLVLRAIDAEGVPAVVDSDRRYGRAEVDVEWRFREQWWFVAGYAHASVHSDFAVESAEANALTLGVRYRGRSAQTGALGL
jgi:hypothetical protein